MNAENQYTVFVLWQLNKSPKQMEMDVNVTKQGMLYKYNLKDEMENHELISTKLLLMFEE